MLTYNHDESYANNIYSQFILNNSNSGTLYVFYEVEKNYISETKYDVSESLEEFYWLENNAYNLDDELIYVKTNE